MKYDKYGVAFVKEEDLVQLLYQQPHADLSKFHVVDPKKYNNSIRELFVDLPPLKKYIPYSVDIDEFDRVQQAEWYMPEEYLNLDIARWVLEQCGSEAELQRCGEELLLYQELDAMDLLRYLKYLVDTMREHNVIWGVGRGSSVASFVLYKIGIHKIDSLYYDLDYKEFLR